MPETGATSRRRRSALSAKSRPPRLTEQDILDTALAFIKANGIEALGMRSLAKQLAVTPMALYHYVPGKEALLDRLAESILAAVPTPPASSEYWEAQLRAFALSIWDCMATYPGLSRIALERPPMKASGRLSMHVFSVLEAAGFEPKSALLGTFGFQIYVGGVVSAQVRGRPRRKPGAKPGTQRAKLPPEAQQFIALLSQVDTRAMMEFGLDTMIAGLRAQRDRRLAASHARN
jgi:TetR/AcrR family tetracycline transcriptional repressor